MFIHFIFYIHTKSNVQIVWCRLQWQDLFGLTRRSEHHDRQLHAAEKVLRESLQRNNSEYEYIDNNSSGNEKNGIACLISPPNLSTFTNFFAVNFLLLLFDVTIYLLKQKKRKKRTEQTFYTV